MKREGIAATRDGDIGHCSKTTTRQKKIVPVVDVAVNTIYSCLHSRPKPYLFSNPLQPTAAIFDSGTIVNTALTFISIRPASGRSLVRVWACGGFDGMPSVRLNQHQSHAYSTQAAASLRVGKVEDQVLPGGGCA